MRMSAVCVGEGVRMLCVCGSHQVISDAHFYQKQQLLES